MVARVHAAVPLFVFAVLGALTLASAGSALGAPPKGVVVAGAVGRRGGHARRPRRDRGQLGLRLPPAVRPDLEMMNSMHGLCVGDCLPRRRRRPWRRWSAEAVRLLSCLLLTNLVLVGWMIAVRGRSARASARRGGSKSTPTAHRSRPAPAHSLRVLLVAGLLGSAVIHAAVVPSTSTEWPAAGVFFVLLARRGTRGRRPRFMASRHRVGSLWWSAAVVSARPLAVVAAPPALLGLPFGPAIRAQPEAVGLPDIICCVVGNRHPACCSPLLPRAASWLRGRWPASAHLRGLAVAAVITVTAIGLAGSMGLPGGDSARSDGHSEMVITNPAAEAIGRHNR